MPLYRCLNCQKVTEAKKPVCQDCNLDPAKDPRDAALLVELVTLHFDPPTRIAGRGVGRAACDEKLRVGTVRATGERDAVTCPACKAAAAFQAAEDATLPSDAMNRIVPVKAAKPPQGGN